MIFVGQDGQHEIQRQNKITEQILTNFFERKFFPNRKPQQKVPTIEEILPSIDEPPNPHNKELKDDEDRDGSDLTEDSLQSVESEHVDSFYGDYLEGRCSLLIKQILVIGIYFFSSFPT